MAGRVNNFKNGLCSHPPADPHLIEYSPGVYDGGAVGYNTPSYTIYNFLLDTLTNARAILELSLI